MLQHTTIKTDKEHEKALARIDEIIDAPEGTPECEERHLLFDLIEAYEDEHYPMDKPEPVEVIKFIMDQQDLTEHNLIPFIGSLDKVNTVLNKTIPLSNTMINALHTGLEIPIEMLMQESESPAPDNVLNIKQENSYNTYEAPAFA
jgi:HTH-type transcriptional regulator / antitoxin HigA